MKTELSFVVVEDDVTTASVVRKILEAAGHKVEVVLDSTAALETVLKVRPDVVITDIMMPGMDGLEVCRRLRSLPELKDIKIVVLSAKGYEADRAQAMAMGADGMINKPFDARTLESTIRDMISDAVAVRYWGVRGTLPIPGKRSLRYGGNTSCFTLELPKGQFFILDAGTGIRELANYLLATRHGPIMAKIFISHPHWDHINALPFFTPLFFPGNEFEVFGAPQGAMTMRELMAAQLDGIHSPIALRNFGARVFFRNLSEEKFTVGDVRVSTMYLAHPGLSLGYRFDTRGKSFCYITDNELHLPGSPQYSQEFRDHLAGFVKGADVLLTDATYTDDEYPKRVNWGHSSVGQVAALAHDAGVKELQLFHHDPDQSDDDIDRKLESAQATLARLDSSVVCTAPAEGEVRRF